MNLWEPLANRVPVDVRRLATQLRRMKDRSGLTVPALAARTAQPVEVWERAFAGRQLPPLDAVEVLAQASGADYERIGALWKLADKASTGTGDRGRGKPVPRPDPLDPLGPEEGLPGTRRRVLLLGGLGLLAMAALVAVILTAVPSTGRAPAREAAPTVPGPGLSAAPAPTDEPPPRSTPPGRPAAEPDPSRTATPSAPTASSAPGDPTPADGDDAHGRTPWPVAPASTAGSTGTAAPPSAPPSTSTAPPSTPPRTPPSSPTPTPTPSLCRGLILLGICIG